MKKGKIFAQAEQERIRTEKILLKSGADESVYFLKAKCDVNEHKLALFLTGNKNEKTADSKLKK